MREVPQRHLHYVLGLLLVIHLILLGFDFANPDAVLTGDRADQRLDKVVQWLEGGSQIEFLLAAGGPGDFAVHGIVYKIGGMPLVLSLQVTMAILSAAGVWMIGRTLGLTSSVSACAALLYGLLPGSLLQPHLLVTEAIFNPCVVWSTYFTLRLLRSDGTVGYAIAAGVLVSMAIFSRLLLVLFPILVVILLFAKSQSARRGLLITTYVMGSFSIPAVWQATEILYADDHNAGETRHDLARNLFGRIDRMSNISEQVVIESSHLAAGRLTPLEFINYLQENPVAYLRTLSSDLSNLLFNSGMNSLAGRYMGFYSMPTDTRFWRDLRDEEGFISMGLQVLRHSPRMAFVNIIGTFTLVTMWLLAVYGCVAMLRSNGILLAPVLLLVLLCGYILAVSQAGITVRWHYRTPIEFALSLWAVFGAGILLQSTKNGEIALLQR